MKELDVVKIKKDYPVYGISKGDRGTILEVFDKPEKAYLVEFAEDGGEAICMEVFYPDELELVWSCP